MKPRQRGVALISVLLIMSLALLLTGAVLRNHRLVLKSTAQQLHQVQVRQAGLAAERWALQRLRRIAQRESPSVNLAQDWAHVAAPIEWEGGTLHVEIEDLAGRFNLSPLLDGARVDAVTQARWLRLLALVRIDNPALHDLSGAGLVALTDVSQLRALAGVDAAVLARLQPLVALLPKAASLNLNTATAQQLMTLDGISAATARTLVQQRPLTGYRSVQAFVEDPLLAGAELGSHGLGLDSRWFRIRVEATFGAARLRLVSDIELDAKTRQARVLQRRLLNPLTSESW
ncbi:general secretion pathway protein K [Pseudomonas sp. ok272]|uniref:type II secretion system protein GspK n=1 Tax=unclassified Pseudomonas TaxID=196821 RepID=UPI0008AC58E6|nr:MULTISPECIES: type II secretion system protein GspK [unclassified Pseudomonas]SEN33911.1 general secretion pathway protein K [Pseudomonas sp. ok272]SFM84790.1 general secretion pathway protein K [Pseudomonas sp. ok602]